MHVQNVCAEALAASVCMLQATEGSARLLSERGSPEGDDHSAISLITVPGRQRRQRRRMPLAAVGHRNRGLGQRELAAGARSGTLAVDVLPAGGHPHAGHRCHNGASSPGFCYRHRAALGHGGTLRRRRGRGVGAAGQCAASRPARTRPGPAAPGHPARPCPAWAVPAVRRRRPQPETSGAQISRCPGRNWPRAAPRRRFQRQLGLHRARRPGKSRVGHLLDSALARLPRLRRATLNPCRPARNTPSAGSCPVTTVAGRLIDLSPDFSPICHFPRRPSASGTRIWPTGTIGLEHRPSRRFSGGGLPPYGFRRRSPTRRC